MKHVIPSCCLATFLVTWLALAVNPVYRDDWLLESLPIFVFVPLAVIGYLRAPLTDGAYVQAMAFAILHTVGSHYTYSEVPIGLWAQDLFGLARNHYDRVVHFCFGLLMLRPLRELGFRGREPEPIARAYFSVAAVALWSLLYEVTEWLVASVADPAAGKAYLGTQGDVWDAEKDMALAVAGAAIAAAGEAFGRRRRAAVSPSRSRSG